MYCKNNDKYKEYIDKINDYSPYLKIIKCEKFHKKYKSKNINELKIYLLECKNIFTKIKKILKGIKNKHSLFNYQKRIDYSEKINYINTFIKDIEIYVKKNYMIYELDYVLFLKEKIEEIIEFEIDKCLCLKDDDYEIENIYEDWYNKNYISLITEIEFVVESTRELLNYDVQSKLLEKLIKISDELFQFKNISSRQTIEEKINFFEVKNEMIEKLKIIETEMEEEKKKEETYEECSICYEKMFDYNMYILGCNHSFHLKCIDKMLEINNNREENGSCPLCRAPIL